MCSDRHDYANNIHVCCRPKGFAVVYSVCLGITLREEIGLEHVNVPSCISSHPTHREGMHFSHPTELRTH